MPEQPADHLQADPSGGAHAGEGVPQIVHPQLGEAGSLPDPPRESPPTFVGTFSEKAPPHPAAAGRSGTMTACRASPISSAVRFATASAAASSTASAECR
jgi:hypothetical protein